MNKFRNKKTNGYDSKKEYNRSIELKMLEKGGFISDLREQVPYDLIPNQYEIVGGKQKLAERKITYVADFVYNCDGKTIVEDVKGMKTDVYKMKKKMMLFFYGIRIKEV